MKSILLPVHPDILANIINGKARLLIRKFFPKDYVGWVYIYCTRKEIDNVIPLVKLFPKLTLNEIQGKIVGRFWCDKVDTIEQDFNEHIGDLYFYENEEVIEENACLDKYGVQDYLDMKDGCAIHISKREVFDRPRELDDFV